MEGRRDQRYDYSYPTQPRTAQAAPPSGYDFDKISSRPDYSGYQEQDLHRSAGVSWKGRAIASLILGIVGGLLLFAGLIIPCIGWLSLPMAGIGLGLGISAYVSMKHANSKDSFGMIIAGIIINGILLALSILFILLMLMLYAAFFSMSSGTIIPPF